MTWPITHRPASILKWFKGGLTVLQQTTVRIPCSQVWHFLYIVVVICQSGGWGRTVSTGHHQCQFSANLLTDKFFIRVSLLLLVINPRHFTPKALRCTTVYLHTFLFGHLSLSGRASPGLLTFLSWKREESRATSCQIYLLDLWFLMKKSFSLSLKVFSFT